MLNRCFQLGKREMCESLHQGVSNHGADLSQRKYRLDSLL